MLEAIPGAQSLAYHPGSIFVLDETPYHSRVDRNLAAKIMRAAEGLERATKKPGRHNGQIGYVGLAVLRALLYRYSRPARITSPSYITLQKATGLCRASVREGLKRLAASGLLDITRRIARKMVVRISPVTGSVESFVGTVQACSLYKLKLSRFLPIAPPLVPLKPSSGNRFQKPKMFSKDKVLELGEAFSFDAILQRRLKSGLGRL